MQRQPLEKKRILLLLPTRTYRATDFLQAALKLNVEVVVASAETPETVEKALREAHRRLEFVILA